MPTQRACFAITSCNRHASTSRQRDEFATSNQLVSPYSRFSSDTGPPCHTHLAIGFLPTPGRAGGAAALLPAADVLAPVGVVLGRPQPGRGQRHAHRLRQHERLQPEHERRVARPVVRRAVEEERPVRAGAGRARRLQQVGRGAGRVANGDEPVRTAAGGRAQLRVLRQLGLQP